MGNDATLYEGPELGLAEPAAQLPAFDPKDPTMVFLSQMIPRWNLAKILVKSGMIPQKTPEAAVTVMLKGHELGIPTMSAFANIFFFDGKLGISADLMAALFIGRVGGRIEVLEWTMQTCKIQLQRPGWAPSVVEYTIEDAQKAGLTSKPNWKNVKAMLSARARATGIRLIAPDVFAGIYSTEELADIADASIDALPHEGLPTEIAPPREPLQQRIRRERENLEAERTEAVEEEEEVVQEDPAPEPPAEEEPKKRAPRRKPAPQNTEQEFATEALDTVRKLVADMSPEGADAAVSVRDRIREAAASLFDAGDETRKKIEALAKDPNLGRTQANILNGRLSMAIAAKSQSNDSGELFPE